MVNGLVLFVLLVFCRIWVINGGSVCILLFRINEYCCGLLICGVMIIVLIGLGVFGNVVGLFVFGIFGINSLGLIGKVLNNVWFIGCVWLICFGVNFSGNNIV